MGNGTRSGLRSKDGDSQSSRKKMDSTEGMSNASGRAATSPGSKQSAKGVFSGQTTSSSPSVRKSERLEKRNPPTTPVMKQSERSVNHGTPGPLRRSDRSKKNISSSTSGSNQAGKMVSSVDMEERKEKKENSLKQLALESQRILSSDKNNQGSVSSKRKRMDAHSYKSLFKSQKRRYSRSDIDGRSERRDRLSQIHSEENGVSDSNLVQDIEYEDHPYDHALSLPVGLRVVKEHPGEPMQAGLEAASLKPVPEFKVVEVNISENDVENISVSGCSNNVSSKTTDDLDRVDGKVSMMGGTNKAMPNDGNMELEDHSSAEILKIPELVAPINMQRSADSDACPDKAAQSVKSKIQNCQRDIQCKVTEKEIGDDVHTLVIEGTCLTLSNLEKYETIGSCAVCYKKRRLAYDSPEEELCSCAPVEKDTGDAKATFSSGSDHDIGLNETTDIQIGSDENICVKCKQPGELLYCCGKGCRRCYHYFCLDPILSDTPPGIWYCSYCTRKKIESGIYTVTKGVESIWDAREVVVLDSKETRRQKQYLTKYQGLAHVYNHWIPESQLLLESPSLVTKYNAGDQGRVWDPDWTVPSRLLIKRPLVSNGPEYQCRSLRTDNILDCQYEWLVKWSGLDYVRVTWELENSNFLQSAQGQKLVREYELRHEKAHRVVDKTTKEPFVKLKNRLSADGLTLSDDCYLQNVYKLRELWYKSQNAVVFDEQERFANVIFFILSLSDEHQPFLITSTLEGLSQWEAEFLRLAPSVDVVVYAGNIDSRTSIRKLEFQEKHEGSILLQVLLAPIEVVIEDLKFMKSLKWKIIVIDGCQGSSMDLEQMKLLETDMRLLLFSGPIKDAGAVYSSLSLLGFSDFPDEGFGLKSDTTENLVKLKELLSRFTAYSKFVEYFVPVEISNLQLEQYCGQLLANAPALRCNWKTDQVGAFKEILMTLRKCCDHPYMVSPKLEPSMSRDQAFEIQGLEFGIEDSGKLQLLHEMLLRIKHLQLRALVLFQSITGTDNVVVGDILDDLMRGKFGSNSYERIDACLIQSKRQAALNKFSCTGGEHFVFLLENRACSPSIKLSVDIVIIFDSDWNPANDLKALQRLSIHSKSGQINVFRLYSSCTVEEKVLILGKQSMNLESSLQMIKFSSILLMWGATHLFSRLENYHAENTADISHGRKLLSDVLSELSAILSCSREGDKSEPVISKVFRNAGTYTTNFPLLGEKKVQLIDEEEPHIFWKKLLDGKKPKWKFSLWQMPRSRKRNQYAQETSKKSDCENDDAARKRKKLFRTNMRVAPPHLELGEEQVEKSSQVAAKSSKLDSKNSYSSPDHQDSFANLNCMAHLQEKSSSDEQKSLHATVKEEMVKLCVVLELTKEVQQMVDKFLEYIMENHHVNKEPVSILQGFQMSLCWTASSILKQKIDRKESLQLAKKILNFKCTEEEALSVFLKLKLLKKTFLKLSEISSVSLSENIKSDSRNRMSPSSRKAGESLSGNFNLQIVKANQELSQVQKTSNMLTGIDLKRRAKKIQKKCDKCISNLHLKHAMEIQDFNKTWESKREKLETGHRNKVIFIRAIHGSVPMGVTKIKMAETEYAKMIADHEHSNEVELERLKEKHSAAIEEKKKIFDNWLADAISCNNMCKTVTEVHSGGSKCEVEIVPNSHAINMIPNLNVASTVETFGCKSPASAEPSLSNSKSEELETAIVETPSILGVHGEENCPSSQAFGDIICSENHVTDEFPSTSENNKMPSGWTCNTGCERGHVHTSGICTPDVVQDADITQSINQYHEMATEVSDNRQEMAPDRVTDTPVGFSLGNDEGDRISEDTRNQEDQLHVHITDSLPSDAVSSLYKESMDMQHEGLPAPGNQTTTIGTVPLTHAGIGTNSVSNLEEFENNEQLEQTSLDKSPGSRLSLAEDVPVPGKQTTTIGTVPLTPSGGGTNSVFDLEEFENNEQLEQASVEKDPGSCLSPVAEDVYQGHCKENNSLQNALGSPQLPESTQVPCQTVSQNVENAVPQPPMEHLDSAGQPDLLAADRADHAPNCEQPTHSPSEEAQVSQVVTEQPNQVISQPGPNLAMVESSHLPLYGAHRAASLNATLPLHADPLQNEVEKIHKEIEQVIKLHDNTKLQLKSDCEKEIEEKIAEIHKKYDAKMKAAEEVFMLKKSDLESNKNKVLMNKILAEAFKYRCMEPKPSRISGVSRVTPNSFGQHIHQLPLPLQQSPVISHHTATVSSQHTPNLPIQPTHRPTGNFSVVTSRPPQINVLTPTIVTSRVGGEVRAPAPHLQPYRPPACTSSASMALPYNPNLQVPVNIPVTSSSLAGLPAQKTLSMTSQLSQPNLPTLGLFPPVKIIQSGPSNQLSITEGGVQPRSDNSTPISALKFLRNVCNQSSGQAPNVSLPSSGSVGGGVDVASDVVCLSDDDN